MFQLGIIVIDLTLGNNFQRVVEDNDLSGKVSPEALASFKKNGYLKIWIDPQSVEVIAYTSSKKSGLIINNDFVSYLKDMPTIREKEMVSINEPTLNDIGVLTIDKILDKISESGMKSLTKVELKFLQENS